MFGLVQRSIKQISVAIEFIELGLPIEAESLN